jgi:hypothetical protein
MHTRQNARGEWMDNYHITKSEKLWTLVKEGAQRASKTAATKAEITALASEFLQGKTASLKIHKEDGTIQEERTFPRAADPRKSKG